MSSEHCLIVRSLQHLRHTRIQRNSVPKTMHFPGFLCLWGDRSTAIRVVSALVAFACGPALADVKPATPDTGDIPQAVVDNPAAGYAVDLRTMLASFRVEDLVVPGNGGRLPIVISRVHDIYRKNPSLRVPHALGNWDLEIPRITAWRGTHRSDGTTFSEHASPNVWSNGYCHNPVYTRPSGDAAYALYFWDGLLLEIPRESGRELLFARQDSANGQVVYPPINVITGVKGNVEYRSTDNWRASCIDLPQGSRSGFLVYSPDGTKYTFDVFAGPKSIVNERMNWDDTLGAYVYASRIEDVHGNWLSLSYESDPNGGQYVSEILASDGRRVKFHYDTVSHTSHPFWRPKFNVKRLSRVEHRSDDNSTVLAEVRYYYYVTGYSEFADHGTLANVRMPDGRYWSYSYQDHQRVLNVGDPRYPPPANYWGTHCDYTVGFANWYCGPTFSTLPAKLTALTTPSGASYEFQYVETSGTYGWIGDRQSDFNYVWRIDRLGTDIDADGTTDWTDFGLSMAPDGATFTATVEYPFDRRDIYHVTRSEFAPGSEQTKARLTTLLGGSLFKREVFDLRSGSPVLLRTTDLLWQKQRFIGDNARTCWIGGCDKPETRSTVLTNVTTRQDGQTYIVEYSNFDTFDEPRQMVESGPGTSRTNVFQYEHDEVRWVLNLVSSHEIVGESLVTQDFTAEGEVEYINENGNEVHFEYDVEGNLYKRKHPREPGQPLVETVYTGYKRGVAQSVTYPTGDILSRVVADDSTVDSETNQRGFVTSYEHDELRRPTLITPPMYSATTIDWWEANPWERVERTGNHEEVLRRDRHDRDVWIRERDVTDASTTYYINYKYDKAGRLVFESRPAASSTYTNGLEYSYDALGRVLKQRDTATGHETLYCYGTACNAARAGRPSVGNGFVVTDADGFESIFEYDSYGPASFLASVKQQRDQAGSDYITTSIARNAIGNIELVTQGGLTRQYIYNSRNLLWRIIEPEIGETVLGYDLAGNVKTKAVAGGAPITIIYDDLNRVKSSTASGSPTTTLVFRYDPNGNVKTMTYGDVVRSLDYDAVDNVISETITLPGQELSSIFEYDQYGLPSATVYPSGTRVTYNPDAFGRPKTITAYFDGLPPRQIARDIVYGKDGSVQTFTYGNNLRYRHYENSRDLLQTLSVETSSSTKIVDYRYVYDGRGNVDTITDGVSPSWSKVMEYDGLSRLTSSGSAALSEVFEYDEVGNIRIKNTNGAVTNFYYTNNKLTSTSSGRAFTYDSRGNIKSDGQLNFNYDGFDNLTSVSGASSRAYEYDASGTRVITTIGSGKTLSFTTTNDVLLHEMSWPSRDSKDFVYLGSQLVASLACNRGQGDIDNDGIPDCFEVRYGSSPYISSDASADADGDGLSNLEEYNLLTNPLHEDSDGDGMPDAYEVEYGLDALTDDAAGDLDNDGISNLDEFINGTNPRFNPAWMVPIIDLILNGG